jgi:Tol biopolymer transport system component
MVAVSSILHLVGALMARILPALALLTLMAGVIAPWLLRDTPRQQIAYYAQHRRGSGIYLLDVPRTLNQPVFRSPYWVLNLAWSPDGERIAFTLQEENTYRLYLMDASGRGLRRLTQRIASTRPISWSPDGEHIIFHATTGAWTALYVIRADGSHLRTLMGGVDNWSADFAWSPGGDRAAFAASLPGSDSLEIYTIDRACVELVGGCRVTRHTTSDTDDYLPTWAGDGRQLAFISHRTGTAHVYVMDMLCQDTIACAQPPHLVSDLRAGDSALAWSPDNRWLAFAVSPIGFGSLLHLTDMTCASCDPLRITPDGESDHAAAWSPDGRWLAYLNRRLGLVADVMLLDIACADALAGCMDAGRRLTLGTGQAWFPVWRP